MDDRFDLDCLIEWQALGMEARAAGFSDIENPISRKVVDLFEDKTAWSHHSRAWLFGWSIEDAARRSNQIAASCRSDATKTCPARGEARRSSSLIPSKAVVMNNSLLSAPPRQQLVTLAAGTEI